MTTTTDRILNFSAGPATLPEPVLEQARTDIWNVRESGIGICEHSHRGPVFDEVLAEAVADCRSVGQIPDEFDILFLQGGATMQFAMVPMNFLQEGSTANYVNTGVWTSKAQTEAMKLGNVHVAYEGQADKFDHCPSQGELDCAPDAAYLHYCSNNTIYGTQFNHALSDSGRIVCDMSSDIFSKPIDWNAFDMIYAGAQKNLGPSGTVLVIVRKDMLEMCPDHLPMMLNYNAIAKKGSRLNTPPAFGIYLMGQVFKWIISEGGVLAMHERNARKAGYIYDALEANSDCYKIFAQEGSRSLMNISFTTNEDAKNETFLKEAASQGMSGLKGHRDLGGIRASIYNAFPEDGCKRFAKFINTFAQSH